MAMPYSGIFKPASDWMLCGALDFFWDLQKASPGQMQMRLRNTAHTDVCQNFITNFKHSFLGSASLFAHGLSEQATEFLLAKVARQKVLDLALMVMFFEIDFF